MKISYIKLIFAFVFYTLSIGNSFANPNFQGINTNIDEITKNYQKEAEQIQERVSIQINNQNANNTYNSYLNDAEQMKQQSHKDLFTSNKDIDEIMQGNYNRELTNSAKGSVGKGAEKTINHLLIFISFSMPKEALKERVMEARKAGATLVLRGIIKDSITETAIALNNLTDKTGVNAIIDPNLYKAFDVKVVPTIVVAKYSTYPCEPTDNNPNDVSCSYVICQHFFGHFLNKDFPTISQT